MRIENCIVKDQIYLTPKEELKARLFCSCKKHEFKCPAYRWWRYKKRLTEYGFELDSDEEKIDDIFCDGGKNCDCQMDDETLKLTNEIGEHLEMLKRKVLESKNPKWRFVMLESLNECSRVSCMHPENRNDEI